MRPTATTTGTTAALKPGSISKPKISAKPAAAPKRKPAVGVKPQAPAPQQGFAPPAKPLSTALTGAPKADPIRGAVGLGNTTDKRIVHSLVNRAAFDKLSTAGTGAGAAGMPEVKFLFD